VVNIVTQPARFHVLPSLVGARHKRSVGAQNDEPSFAGDGLNPVGFLAIGALGSEVMSVEPLAIVLYGSEGFILFCKPVPLTLILLMP